MDQSFVRGVIHDLGQAAAPVLQDKLAQAVLHVMNGPAAPPEPEKAGPPTLEQMRAAAYSLLGLLPTAEPEVVRAAYQALSKKHHPDKGGDPVLMAEINAAYQWIREKKRP